jgi:hypothetical protein
MPPLDAPTLLVRALSDHPRVISLHAADGRTVCVYAGRTSPAGTCPVITTWTRDYLPGGYLVIEWLHGYPAQTLSLRP